MFNNFLNRLKINLLFLKNNLLFFFKSIKLTFLTNIIYFFVLYNCLVQISDNIFLYNFIGNFFLFISVNYSLLLFLLFYYVVSVKSILLEKSQNTFNSKKKSFLTTSSNNSIKNFNNILLPFNYYISNLEFVKSILSYFYRLCLFYIAHILKNLFLANYIVNTIKGLTTKVSWYPIFKRHSIFGYYRINRQR